MATRLCRGVSSTFPLIRNSVASPDALSILFLIVTLSASCLLVACSKVRPPYPSIYPSIQVAPYLIPFVHKGNWYTDEFLAFSLKVKLTYRTMLICS